jgi:hypothetical protein
MSPNSAADRNTHDVVGPNGASDADADQGTAQQVAQASERRIRMSTTMALILAILGSSVLPMSYAFATTGILAGFLISVVRIDITSAALTACLLALPSQLAAAQRCHV